MLFSLLSADPVLSKHRKNEYLDGCFLSSFQLFMRSLNFRPWRSWPLRSNPSERRWGREPVAENKKPVSWRGAGTFILLSAGRTAIRLQPAGQLPRGEIPGGNYLPALRSEHLIPPCRGQEICRVRVARALWVWWLVRRDSWWPKCFWHPINGRMGWSSSTLRALSISSSFTSHQTWVTLAHSWTAWLVLSNAPLVFSDVLMCERESFTTAAEQVCVFTRVTTCVCV